MRKIDPGHPLTSASWLWPWGAIYLKNCHAQFRRDFTLNRVPGKAPFFITADQSYRLWCNGTLICRGPARGYVEHLPFDEIDLSPHLVEGHNFLSIEAYNPGIGTFRYIHKNCAGLLAAAEWEELSLRTGDGLWQMRRAPGSNPDVAILSRQLAWQEDHDAASDDGSWIVSPETPQWEPHRIFSGYSSKAYGQFPYDTLEYRELPLLQERLAAPERVSAAGIGLAAGGYRNAQNISWHWVENEAAGMEFRRVPAEFAVREKDALSFTVEPAGEGRFRAITLDLGEISFGSLRLELDGCAGGEIVDCHYHQYLADGTPRKENLIPAGENGGLLALATRLRTRENHTEHEFFTLMGGQHITLVFRDFSSPARVRASFRCEEYPFAMRGKLHTSDSRLNAIWEICRYTQRICSADAFMDTPWREQGQWWGDARLQARNTFFFDGDTRLLRRGLFSIAGQQDSSGLVQAVAPCVSGGCVLPDFSLVWIMTLYDYFFQTGDLAVFRELRPVAEETLAYFDTPEARGENNLLRHDPRYWLFEDWSGKLPRRGYPAFLNLWYPYALGFFISLLEAAGDHAEAARWQAKKEKHLAAAREAFYDRERKLFRAGLEANGSSVAEAPSIHDQVLAILLGLCPEAHATMFHTLIAPFLAGEKTAGAEPGSGWSSYLLDAMQLMGKRGESLDFIRREWGKMVDYGSGTWEHFNFDEMAGQSCSHAWSAHAATHLTELLTGVKQLAPRWEKIAFDFIPGSLLPESGELVLPLPPGDLAVRWQGRKAVFSIPEKCEVTVKEQTLTSGEHTLWI